MIASENFASPQVMEASGSILTNKYAEGLPDKRYYGGCQVVDVIENLAIERLKTLFGAGWANVQPHSGAQANAAVMLAIINPGDKILGFDLAHGGHLTHGSPVNFSGKIYQPFFYGVDENTGLINWEQVETQALKEKPKLIICSLCIRQRLGLSRFRRLRIRWGPYCWQIFRIRGLISRGHNDPLGDIFTGTTHKT